MFCLLLLFCDAFVVDIVHDVVAACIAVVAVAAGIFSFVLGCYRLLVTRLLAQQTFGCGTIVIAMIMTLVSSK